MKKITQFLSCLLMFSSTHLYSKQISVKKIHVNIKADSAKDAKTDAIATGAKIALEKFFSEQIDIDADLSMVENAEIMACVVEYSFDSREILDRKNTYSADINYVFSSEAVEKLCDKYLIQSEVVKIVDGSRADFIDESRQNLDKIKEKFSVFNGSEDSKICISSSIVDTQKLLNFIKHEDEKDAEKQFKMKKIDDFDEYDENNYDGNDYYYEDENVENDEKKDENADSFSVKYITKDYAHILYKDDFTEKCSDYQG